MSNFLWDIYASGQSEYLLAAFHVFNGNVWMYCFCYMQSQITVFLCLQRAFSGVLLHAVFQNRHSIATDFWPGLMCRYQGDLCVLDPSRKPTSSFQQFPTNNFPNFNQYTSSVFALNTMFGQCTVLVKWVTVCLLTHAQECSSYLQGFMKYSNWRDSFTQTNTHKCNGTKNIVLKTMICEIIQIKNRQYKYRQSIAQPNAARHC